MADSARLCITALTIAIPLVFTAPALGMRQVGLEETGDSDRSPKRQLTSALADRPVPSPAQSGLETVPGAVEQLHLREFKRVEGLGAEVPTVFVVKGEGNAEYRNMRFAESRRLEQEGSPYGTGQMRGWTSDGFVAVGPLSQAVVGNRPLWKQEGFEPYALATHDGRDLAVLAFGNELRLRRISNDEPLEVITHPKFRYLHTVEFSPDNPDVVLLASYGADRILEFNLKTREIVWEWNPWHLPAYARNAFGIHLVEKGDPLPAGGKVLTREEARRRVLEERRHPLEGEVPVRLVDFEEVDHPSGLEPWELTVRPNWAGYSKTRGKVLASLFFTNQVVEIDQATGQVRVLFGDLYRPHGVVPIPEGHLISDTGNGRVLLTDNEFRLRTEVVFSSMPPWPGLEHRAGFNWIQHTYPIGESLYATVDSQRSAVFVWNPKTRQYSAYPYNTAWTVQELRPLTSERFLERLKTLSPITAPPRLEEGVRAYDLTLSGALDEAKAAHPALRDGRVAVPPGAATLVVLERGLHFYNGGLASGDRDRAQALLDAFGKRYGMGPLSLEKLPRQPGEFEPGGVILTPGERFQWSPGGLIAQLLNRRIPYAQVDFTGVRTPEELTVQILQRLHSSKLKGPIEGAVHLFIDPQSREVFLFA